MYKYQVEVFDKDDPFNLKLYITITADGYCAELEVRKIYPYAKIGEVTRVSNYIKR